MIQIKRENLNALAQKHFNKIREAIETSLQFYLNQKDQQIKPLYEYLLKNLELIVTGKPKELELKIIKEIHELTVHEKINLTSEKETLKLIFNYDTTKNRKAFISRFPIKSDVERWGAYQLAKELNVTVCPYCNRQTTYTIQTDRGKTRPEFDHFFHKSKYPYLALSFYNLIPSCHVCNSNLKGSKQFSLADNIHPYEDGFENKLMFQIKLIKSDSFQNGKNDSDFGLAFFYGNIKSFKIQIKKEEPITDYEKKANNNIKIFHIEELYNEHKDYVYEIIKKEIVYNDNYLESLYNQYAGTLFSNFEDVQRMVLSNYISDEQLEKRPLAKLTKDISIELGLI